MSVAKKLQMSKKNDLIDTDATFQRHSKPILLCYGPVGDRVSPWYCKRYSRECRRKRRDQMKDVLGCLLEKENPKGKLTDSELY